MTTYEIALIAGMAAVTFLVRWPVLALVSRITLPQVILDGLKFIPPAVLAAIIAPAMIMPSGKIDLHPSNAYLMAGIVAGLLAWRTRNLLATIMFGMAFFVIWRWLW
jgi:branched-subunit amino acid transport protein